MRYFTQIFIMILVTILMGITLSNTLQIDRQQKQLDKAEILVDSLVNVNDSLLLTIDTLKRESEIWDFGIQKKTEFLINAMIHVESRGNDSAYCASENAVGCLQIRPCMLYDVNRILKKTGRNIHYTLSDRYDRNRSIEMFYIYCNYYNLNTLEDMARAWNGGPRGVNKTTTVGYWNKVKNQLQS